jgi:biopolymer transport protein ExbB
LAAVYLKQRNQPKEVREDLLRREGLLIIAHLDKGLRWLAMLAQISTLLGLLATFHVMIMRFSQGQAAGNFQTNFISGVWEALLTTMYGLMIAIPCSAIYQVLEGRVDALARHMDILVSYMDEWQREKKSQDVKQNQDVKQKVNEDQVFGISSIERA